MSPEHRGLNFGQSGRGCLLSDRRQRPLVAEGFFALCLNQSQDWPTQMAVPEEFWSERVCSVRHGSYETVRSPCLRPMQGVQSVVHLF